MNSVTAPIATSFSLSVLLHGAAFAALLLVYDRATTTGQGVEIELIPSTMISFQQETDVPRKHDTQIDSTEKVTDTIQKIKRKPHVTSQDVLISHNTAFNVSDHDRAAEDLSAQRQQGQWNVERNIEQQLKITDEGSSSTPVIRSTNAAQRQLSIIGLLHDSISNNKEYPYIARRQRREGVVTVGFVLYPDGSIENAYLVTSSSTDLLDRAALSAVKRIEPFKPAQDYLDHAEAFKIDVVFNLL